MRVLVVGTGYVGLTTGVALAYLGNQVTCLDIDKSKVATLKEGICPIFEPGLQELMSLSRGNIDFSSTYEEVDFSILDVIFIAVGTPSLPDGSCDLGQVKTAAESIGQHLGNHFTVVVNKSTVPIGSGNWVDTLVRESYNQKRGSKPDGNYAIASNPEFLRQGSAIFDTLYPERIVIGADNERAIDILTNLYRPLLNQGFPAPSFIPRPEKLSAVPVVTCNLASAELIKYAANAFLAVKISFVNEIARLTSRVGADILQVTRGIGLDSRIGSRFLEAGIGWGGSCFGKDTAALLATSREYNLSLPIVQAAREVNYNQRTWVVETLLHELNQLAGKTIALLGLAFKENTDDLRDAPAVDIARQLIQRGATVAATDPAALENARRQYSDLGITYFDDPMEALQGADAVILITKWPAFTSLDWKKIKQNLKNHLILDGRNFLDGPELENLGYRYIGVGR